MESKHEVKDAKSSENIIDTIKEASHCKSGSQKEKLMDVIHPSPSSCMRHMKFQHSHIIPSCLRHGLWAHIGNTSDLSLRRAWRGKRCAILVRRSSTREKIEVMAWLEYRMKKMEAHRDQGTCARYSVVSQQP
jgi:hypothetical protein